MNSGNRPSPYQIPNSSDDPASQRETTGSSKRTLTQFDCICIIVGTIIGSGIFKMPSILASIVPDIFSLILVWVLGGLVALIGALCFAELTTTYPDRGGDYGYLKRAFDRRVGFAFSWCAFWIVRPANIGLMSMIFGEFAAKALPGTLPMLEYAILAIVIVSACNLIGVKVGKTAQNVLTVAKVVGILLIVFSPFLLGGGQPNPNVQSETKAATASLSPEAVGPSAKTTVGNQQSEDATQPGWFWLAMVLVMFVYGGWNDIAFVASEVQEPKRILFRSLVLGTLLVLVVYLLVNAALLLGLGFDAMGSLGVNATSKLVEQGMGQVGNRVLSALVCVSCLGSINAMIFTSPRIYWATATDYSALSWLAGDNQGSGWWRAMLLQAIVTLLFLVTFGRSANGFTDLTLANAPFFWSFLGLTIVAMIVMRYRLDGQFTGYKTPLFPLLPLMFLLTCGFMVYRSWTYLVAKELTSATFLMAGWLLVGVGLSFLLNRNPSEME